jgi:drug/metabolite transporter (DMT)-like permease
MNSRTQAEIFLLLVTLIWGSTFAITKFALEDASPFLYTSLRFILASILFGVFAFPKLKSLNRRSFVKGGILGVLLFIGFATQTVGLQYTTASKSAFVTGMMVVFTPLCQVLIERRLPKLGNIIGVCLVTVGLYFLTSPSGSEFNLGDGLTLICAVSFGFYIVYLDMFSQDCDAYHLTAMQFFTTAILATVVGLCFEDRRVEFTKPLLLSLAYLSVFASVIALSVQARYQKFTTPTRAAVIFSVEPVIAAVFAYFMLGEQIGGQGILGAGIILCGLLVSEFSDLILKTADSQG